MSGMIGRDKWGHPLYIATICGHPARFADAKRCKPCDVERRRGVPIRTRKYANCLGTGPNGYSQYLAPCGHAVTTPNAKECWDCRVAGATSYPTEGSSEGREKKHRIIAERVLGRPLKENETVHHINLDKRDFRNCNLLICDKQYHAYLHAAMERKYGEMCNPPIQRTA